MEDQNLGTQTPVLITRDSVGVDTPPLEEWETFRKIALTKATRMVGPFEVETSEGRLHCEDGWLAIDARGYPYPIADDEFALIYDRAVDVGDAT